MTEKELEKIYNEAYRAVYWTAVSLLKNDADAEDVVQDVFVTLIESGDTIKDMNKVTAWLKKITVNKCLDRLKLARTDNMDEEFFDSVEALPEDFLPDSIVESDEMRRIVMDIIEKSLSDDVRRTLILFYFDEMSTKEIAEALGIPQGTVSWRINFAKKTIKKEVEKYEEENKTKLFSMAAVPFLSKLFIKEAEQVPFKVMPASLTSALSASAKASIQGAGTKIAASAAKKGTGIMIKKVVIGSVAATVSVAAVVGGIVLLTSKDDKKPEVTMEIEETEVIEETSEEFVASIQETEETAAAETEATSESSETSQNAADDHLYSFAGMSADETLALLLDLSDVSTGDQASAYLEKFPVTPRNMDEDKHIYLFKNADAMNCITSVTLKDVDNANDGTFITQTGSTVTIILETDDAEFADELYEKAYGVLCEYAGADAHGEPHISDDRDESVWGCTIIYSVEVDANAGYDEVKKVGGETHYYKLVSCCISRTLYHGEYRFTIDLPLV